MQRVEKREAADEEQPNRVQRSFGGKIQSSIP
jgi:hypothetical protein